MDTLVPSQIKATPVRGFEQLAELRAQRHEILRWRHNVTSCRSPTREIDTKLIKDEMKKKRHQEFLKRRSMNLEPCGPGAETFCPKFDSKLPHANIQNGPAGHVVMIAAQSSATRGPGSHRQVTNITRTPPLSCSNAYIRFVTLFLSDQVRLEKGQTSTLTSTSSQNVASGRLQANHPPWAAASAIVTGYCCFPYL